MRKVSLAAGAISTILVASLAAIPGPAQARDGNDVAARKRQAQAAASKPADGSRAAAAAKALRGDVKADGELRLAVGFKDGVSNSAATSALRGAGVSSRANAPLAKLGVRSVPVTRSEKAEVIADLKANPAVAYVEEDAVVRAAVVPNDPEYPNQIELPQITVPNAWDVTTGSAIKVAVIDTGVSAIGDIAGAVLPGVDLVNNDGDATDDHGHGTAVSSLIAARGNNGAGMAGVCWSCQILPVKVLDSTGSGYSTTTAAGIVWATDQGAKIINLSLGGYTSVQAQADAVAYAQARGAIVVASAGNDAVGNRSYPAAYNGVVAVGGTDENSDYFVAYDPWIGIYGSNYGPDWVDVAAPWCTRALDLATAGYDWFCGTSASAPLVSGVIALQRTRQPSARNSATIYGLTSTSRPTATTGFTQFGEIRAGSAVNAVDTANPRVTGAGPAHGYRFRGAVTLTAYGVSDTGGSGVSNVALYANGSYVGRDYSYPYQVRYNSGSRNGTIRFVLRVFDRAGNYADYTRYLIADNKAPSVTFSKAPKNNAKVKGTVTIKAGASDAGGINRVELLVNGKVVARDYKAAYSFKLKVSKYGKKLKVQLRAVDKVGNTKTVTRNWKR